MLPALIVSSHLEQNTYAHSACRSYLYGSFFFSMVEQLLYTLTVLVFVFLLQATALFLFKLSAYVTETAIFLALGLSVSGMIRSSLGLFLLTLFLNFSFTRHYIPPVVPSRTLLHHHRCCCCCCPLFQGVSAGLQRLIPQ